MTTPEKTPAEKKNAAADAKKFKKDVYEALVAAYAAPYVAKPACGCGRAYVCFTGGSSPSEYRATVNAVSAACKKLGVTFLRKAYGTSNNSIYVGYDNADGRALGKAKAMAAALTASGFPAYEDAVAD